MDVARLLRAVRHPVTAGRNVIAGNGRAGDTVSGAGITVDAPGSDLSHDNSIIGNYIGIKSDGRQPLSNEKDGIRLYCGTMAAKKSRVPNPSWPAVGKRCSWSSMASHF